MVSSRHISIKVCGRPNSNSGFVPLIIVNNPLFTIEDRYYKGFDACSSFFAIASDNVQTLYKLVMNNVRSYGVIRRCNPLVLGLAIPHGYELNMGYTPYDILCRLREEFVKTCLICKDAERGVFEFRANKVNPNLFDNIVKEYTISPTPKKVVRNSKQSNTIAYVVKPEASIEMLFHDTNYPEFELYSEILIAERVGETDYIHLDIEIPRRKAYSLIIDGIKKFVCTDINKTLLVKTSANGDCFENKSMSFTIQQLKDGYFIPGVELLEDLEEIRISTRGWAIPKRKKIVLRIVPQKFEECFPIQLLKINLPYGQILLNKDMSFTLEGEQISELKKGTIKVSLKKSSDYIISGTEFYRDELLVKVAERNYPHKGERHKVLNTPISHIDDTLGINTPNVLNVYLITILLHGHCFEEGPFLYLKLRSLERIIASSLTKFERIGRNAYEGNLIIPQLYLSPRLSLFFYSKGKEYKSHVLTFCNNKSVLEEEDFVVSNVSFLYKRKLWIVFIITLLIIVGSFVSGYGLSSYIDKKNSSHNETCSTRKIIDQKGEKKQITEVSQSNNTDVPSKSNMNYNCNLCEMKFKAEKELKYHIKVKHKSNRDEIK